MITTKSLPGIVRRVCFPTVWGKNDVQNHHPTESNPVGQTSMGSICDDIINIVMNSSDESAAWRNLMEFFQTGEVVKPR